MKREIDLIRSETWSNNDIATIGIILQETINDFVDEGDTIINIEAKEDRTGLSRFWIYTIKAPKK